MSEMAPRSELLDVLTGEVLPATTENAHRALTSIREMEVRLRDVKSAVTYFVIEESKRLGTRTFHTSTGDLSLTGGPGVDYDAEKLADCLREAGCPEQRIYNDSDDEVEGVIQIEQTFKVRKTILKQLMAANPDYKAAAELAEVPTEKPYRVGT
jgi:hypothetical protein